VEKKQKNFRGKQRSETIGGGQERAETEKCWQDGNARAIRRSVKKKWRAQVGAGFVVPERKLGGGNESRSLTNVLEIPRVSQRPKKEADKKRK